MIIMRIPQQVSERVKEAPAQALRTVFSGIGQVLLVADRIKNRAAEPKRAQPAVTERRGQPGQGAPAAPKDEARWRSLDETGNVRLLSEDESPQPAEPAAAEPAAVAELPAVAEPAAARLAAQTEPATDTEPSAVPEATAVAQSTAPEPTAPGPAVTAGPAAAPEPAVAAETVIGPEQAALPVPNYDDRTVASLRARLRNLDSAQVRALLDYEKANAGRAAVLTMFERRITKLDSGEA
jgi:hypothetical protein